MRYTVVEIPLNRPEIIDFLTPPRTDRHGTQVHILAQRPAPAAERAWIDQLRASPTVETIISRDDPHHNLIATTTDRLLPLEPLRNESDYLTRNMGGWTPIFFGVMVVDDWQADPVLRHANVLMDYGERIRFLGSSAAVSAGRVEEETGCKTVAEVAEHIIHLHEERAKPNYLDRLYDTLTGKHQFSDTHIPQPFLLDEMLGEMVRLESKRRTALADGDTDTAGQIAEWLQRHKEESGMVLVFKGEYIMGRHRRSAVLLVPELGVVIKQPAPEPFHEAAMGARTYNGKPENVPRMTRNGELVTAGGRIRLTIERDKVGKINEVFGRDIQFCSLLGVIVEPFVTGPTLQDYVLADPTRLTPDIYDKVMLHQQVCELLDAENGDWHSANFIVKDDTLVHIDWGAARPLKPDEHTPDAYQERVNQVSNIAFSFHNEDLAERVNALHDALINDADRLQAITSRAESMIESVGLRVLNAPDDKHAG